MGHAASKDSGRGSEAVGSNGSKHSILSLRRKSHKKRATVTSASSDLNQYEVPPTTPAHHNSKAVGSMTDRVSALLTLSGTSNKQELLEKYFNQYRDEQEDAILAEGMEKFCSDLGVDPTEYIVLVLAWKFEASQMCRFTHEEFINGCQKMKVHDVKSLRSRFPEMKEEVKDQDKFKSLYRFTFTFGLDQSTGQRSLPVDMAIPLWELVFEQNRTPILSEWCKFLKETNVKGISRDTWNLFLPFSMTVNDDFSNYDESEAWPSLFDDFVDYQKQRL